MLSLILRFYDPTSGVVSFDGVPLVDVDPLALRQRIALVPQDAVVFAASIRDNIRFGRPDASDAEVERAAELAHALEFISLLPQKFDTAVGGVLISLVGWIPMMAFIGWLCWSRRLPVVKEAAFN